MQVRETVGLWAQCRDCACWFRIDHTDGWWQCPACGVAPDRISLDRRDEEVAAVPAGSSEYWHG